MILETAIALSALGLALFVIGSTQGNPGIAMIGAVVVIGVGASAMVGGVQVQSGTNEETITTNTTITLEDVGDAELTTKIDESGHVGAASGIDFSSDGRMMAVSDSGNGQIHIYNSSSFELSLATHQNDVDVSNNTSAPTDVHFANAGETAYLTDDAGDSVEQYSLADPYNFSTASHERGLDVSARDSLIRGISVHHNGTKMLVLGADSADLYEYTLEDPYNLSSAVYEQNYSIGDQEATPNSVDIIDDGTTMMIMGEDFNTVFQYELTEPYDLETASYTGNALDVSGNLSRASGVELEEGDKMFITGRKTNILLQYDITEETTKTVAKKRKVYENIETQADFPVGIVTMLAGGVLFIAASGRASDTDIRWFNK